MSRYIDADALHDALKVKQLWVVRCGDKHNVGYTYDQVHFAIDDAPSINIVRCKECKWLRYCETEELDLYLDCDKPDGGGIPRNEDWFCADGERREP